MFETHSLSDFSSINLNQMDEVSLLKRIDQKFLITNSELTTIFPLLSSNYSCLTINDIRCFDYSTTYFDDANFTMYNDHHNGKLSRIKIRFRDYETTQNSFLEIKIRTNKGTVVKERKPVNFKDHNLSKVNLQFLSELKINLN